MSSLPAPEAQLIDPSVRAGASIAGLGVALPPKVVDNAQATSRVEREVDDDWIVRRTGIRERHHAEPTDQLALLAAEASRGALDDAGIAATDIDLILLGTVTADHITPGCAPLVAAELGTFAGALDVNAACAGFVSALSLGAAMIEAGRASRVLAIGAEIISRHVDPRDLHTAAIFGDGAGAVVLEASSEARVGPAVLGADGSYGHLIVAPRDTGMMSMDGHEVFRQAIVRMTQATTDACDAAGMTLDDIDVFVFHQANARILVKLAERLGLSMDRVVNSIAGTGNTSAASVPLALAAARDEGRLTDGSRVLLCALGAGLTWASAVVTWGRGG